LSNPTNRSAQIQITLIALVFFGPLIFAAWMYYSGRLAPTATSNHGDLIEPLVSLQASAAGERLGAQWPGLWQLVVSETGECGEGCREALVRMRQIRLMLGKDMDRVGRVFLHGNVAPDRVWLDAEHPGLKTTNDMALVALLAEHRPAASQSGGMYLVDPLVNLVMYFPPDLDPADVVDDLKHLLKLSRIG